MQQQPPSSGSGDGMRNRNKSDEKTPTKSPKMVAIEEAIYDAFDTYIRECESESSASTEEMHQQLEIDGDIQMDPLTNIVTAKLKSCSDIIDFKKLSETLSAGIEGYSVRLQEKINHATGTYSKVLVLIPFVRYTPQKRVMHQRQRGWIACCCCCIWFKLLPFLVVLSALVVFSILAYGLYSGQVSTLVDKEGNRHWSVGGTHFKA